MGLEQPLGSLIADRAVQVAVQVKDRMQFVTLPNVGLTESRRFGGCRLLRYFRFLRDSTHGQFIFFGVWRYSLRFRCISRVIRSLLNADRNGLKFLSLYSRYQRLSGDTGRRHGRITKNGNSFRKKKRMRRRSLKKSPMVKSLRATFELRLAGTNLLMAVRLGRACISRWSLRGSPLVACRLQ